MAHVQAIEYLSFIARPGETLLIGGDFDLPSVASDDQANVLLPVGTRSEDDIGAVDEYLANELVQLNDIRNSNNRILDLVFCTESDDVRVCRSPFPLKRAYHDLPAIDIQFDCVMTLDDSLASAPTPSYIFSKANTDVMTTFYSWVNWDDVLTQTQSIDLQVDRFYEVLLNNLSISN